MSDELIKEILEIIRSSKGFVLEQAPDVARQMVLLGRIQNPIKMIFDAALIFSAYKILKITYKKVNEDDMDDIVWFPAGIGTVALVIFGVFLGGLCLEDGLKAWLSPKLYLLSELSSLAHGKCGK